MFIKDYVVFNSRVVIFRISDLMFTSLHTKTVPNFFPTLYPTIRLIVVYIRKFWINMTANLHIYKMTMFNDNDNDNDKMMI